LTPYDKCAAVAVIGRLLFAFSSRSRTALQSPCRKVAGELQHPRGVLDDLHGFEAGQFVEEPPQLVYISIAWPAVPSS